MNIEFVVGTVGGGAGELFALRSYILRGSEIVNNQLPTMYENGVVFRYISNHGQTSTDETRNMFQNGSTFDSEEYLARIRAIIKDYPDANRFLLGGAGTGLFIDQVMAEYPGATYYFVERLQHGVETEVVRDWEGGEIVEAYEAYVNTLNNNIETSITTKLTSLGLEFKNKDTVVSKDPEYKFLNFPHFSKPIQLAIYKA